jgi:hypothetical protein
MRIGTRIIRRRLQIGIGRLMMVFAALTCIVLLFSCKTTSQAAAAAKQLAGTASELSSYYNEMSTEVDETVALNEIQQAVFDVPFPDSGRTVLIDIKRELGKRATMAQSLSKLASAYANLAGSTAPSDASTAGSKLGSELQTVGALSKTSPVPTELSEAAKIVLGFVQTRELKTGAKAIRQTVIAVREVYDREKPEYESLSKTRITLAASLAKKLVDKDQVDLNSVLAPALKPFDFSPMLRPGSSPREYKDLAKIEIDELADERTAASVQSADSISNSLHAADQNLTLIVTGKPSGKAAAQ